MLPSQKTLLVAGYCQENQQNQDSGKIKSNFYAVDLMAMNILKYRNSIRQTNVVYIRGDYFIRFMKARNKNIIIPFVILIGILLTWHNFGIRYSWLPVLLFRY